MSNSSAAYVDDASQPEQYLRKMVTVRTARLGTMIQIMIWRAPSRPRPVDTPPPIRRQDSHS
ncbi:hypothetical protein M407DRAFT_33831 [Tulasnella calospora MUT 4182]|uniref:Uncharacterized protein n=1 Tax=Tulasnella calospora MUT 4182 TaxID=1051891 RepID=A0A0C3PPU5_9AGAM|nr:hypothetical protein M407DRAFT_33831 [Tulasnella calospora MUT 4182]